MPNLFPSPLCPTEKVTEEQLATDLAVLELDRTIHQVSRRSFFSTISALGAATAAGLIAMAPTAQAQAQSAAPSIPEILNFALNLEYLEANLYIAVSGSGPLASADGAGQVINSPGKLSLDSQTMATAENLANDERHHIELLRALLLSAGITPISQPEIDYSMGGKLKITTQAQFLAVARQFTAVGNSAYGGAAQYLVSNPLVLTGAGQILGAEGQHLGGLNYLCAEQGVVSPMVDAMDVPPASAPDYNFFTITSPTSALETGPALGPARTPQQVLGIVFGTSTPTTKTPAAGTTSGGFFPKGVNGSIRST